MTWRPVRAQSRRIKTAVEALLVEQLVEELTAMSPAEYAAWELEYWTELGDPRKHAVFAVLDAEERRAVLSGYQEFLDRQKRMCVQ